MEDQYNTQDDTKSNSFQREGLVYAKDFHQHIIGWKSEENITYHQLSTNKNGPEKTTS